MNEMCVKVELGGKMNPAVFELPPTTKHQIVLSTQKNPHLNLGLNQARKKKLLAKFPYPKKSQNWKFQTQKNPSIIPVARNPE